MYTLQETIDAVITEMYEMMKALVSGNYTAFCALFADIMSRMAAVRKGVKEDKEADKKIIEDLKAQLDRALTHGVDEGGGVIGGETTTLDFDPFKE